MRVFFALLLLLAPALSGAQTVVSSTGGSSSSSGLTIGTTAITSGTASRLLYEDASNLLGESAALVADMSGAGNGTWTFRKTSTSGPLPFFSFSGTSVTNPPTGFAFDTSSFQIDATANNDVQVIGAKVILSGDASNEVGKSAAAYFENSPTKVYGAQGGSGIYAKLISANSTPNSNYGVGVSGTAYVNGGTGFSIGVGGFGTNYLMGAGGVGIGVAGMARAVANSVGIWATLRDVGSAETSGALPLAYPPNTYTGMAALLADNSSAAASIFVGRDNGTAVFTIADGGDIQIGRTVTAGGTTGAQTINKAAGTVNFAAAATSIVVTNSLVTTSSIIFTTMRTADSTCTNVNSVVPAAGSFTITVNAGCNAETSVGFLVTN